MPTLLHETLLLLFQNRPRLAAELIGDVLGVALPEYDSVEQQDANLNQVVPTEYRADLVVLLKAKRPVLGIVVEVQLTKDEAKQYSWPLYVTALRGQYRCPCLVLVVTPKQEIASWAAQPVHIGPPGSILTPLVVGPESIPVVTEAARARRSPELALLSVQAHGRTGAGYEVALAALAGAVDLDDDRAMLYCDLIQLAVGESVRKQLEDDMRIQDYEFKSQFARRYLSQGRAEALLRIIAARGLAVTEDQRAQILQCADPEKLDGWLDRVVTVNRAEELFH